MCWALPLLKTCPVSTLSIQYYLLYYVVVSPSFWLMQLGMLLENLAFWLWESHGSQHWSTPRYTPKCIITLGGVGVDIMANPFCTKSNTSQRRSYTLLFAGVTPEGAVPAGSANPLFPAHCAELFPHLLHSYHILLMFFIE